MITPSTRTPSPIGTLLLVGLSVTGCSASGHLTPLGHLPHDVQVVFDERDYPVRGADEESIGRSIAAHGLTSPSGRTVAARFQWNVESDYTWEPAPEDEGCVMREVRIRVTASLTMPRWERPSSAPPGLAAAWERYMTALHTHEEGHRDHVLGAAREIRRALMRLETENCSFMRGDAQALRGRILERWKRMDLEYEVETENGRTQGAIWPPRG